MGIDELVQVVQSLNSDDAFRARLNPLQWRTLGAYLAPYEVRAGDLLIRQGEVDRTAYFLGRGSLSVYRSGSGARRVGLLRVGSLVGETGLFSDQAHAANVEAMTPSTVWALHLPRFEELASRAPAIAIELLRASGAVLAARMRANLVASALPG
jgi:CRP/FNR family transcriptional regulator, cyclic AMP receptor protein